MKLNNKGFSLVELLAVVVILGILVAFMYPSVNKFINDNNEKNYKKLKDTIKSAAKMYISDYKYELSLSNTCPRIITYDSNSDGNNEINNSKISVKTLVDEGNIKTDKYGDISDPRNKEKKLDLGASYIKVTYNCDIKDFVYEEITDTNLIWK